MHPIKLFPAASSALRRWAFLGLFALAGLSVSAQGTLHFSNYGPGIGSDARVLDAQGNPLGPGFLAQLYASAPGGTLAPVGSPTPFLNHPTTGAASGYVIGDMAVVPGVAASGPAQVQLRAWPASVGATYEAALAAGASVGASAVLATSTGGGISPPGSLRGLQGFSLARRLALTLLRNPVAGGTIQATPAPGADGRYAVDTTVTLTAVPAVGYVFNGWTGAGGAATPTTSVKLTADTTVTATFRLLTPGSVQFSKGSHSVPEAGGQVVLTVNRTGGTDGAVTARYQLASGATATAAADFTFTAGTLSWADGDGTPKTFVVGIVNDFAVEPAETIRLQLLTPTGGLVIGDPSVSTVTITDDDIAGTLQFERATWWGTESGGSATITVTRMGGSSGPVSVAFATSDGSATAPGDYTATSGRLSWANGDAAPKTFQVPLKNDGLAEETETIHLTLSAPEGGASLGVPGLARIYLAAREPDAWLEMFAGVHVRGTVGRTYQILAGNDLTPGDAWLVVAEITLTKPVELWIDPETPVRDGRLYRFREKP